MVRDAILRIAPHHEESKGRPRGRPFLFLTWRVFLNRAETSDVPCELDRGQGSKAMKHSSMTAEQLVARYIEIGVTQYDALMMEEIVKFNRLFDRMVAVEDELQRRTGDQRRLLLALYDHENPQVRLNAIKATLALAPHAGRKALEALREAGEGIQSMDAGMCMFALDEGIFKPS